MTELSKLFESPLSHVRRAIDAVRRPTPDKDWCVCRFVESTDFAGGWDSSVGGYRRGPPEYGWPLRNLGNPCHEMLGGLGWSKGDPVAFFSADEAVDVAGRAGTMPIAFDAPVQVSAIRWTVCLYSHFDGSKLEGETNDFEECMRAYASASAAALRENTPTVAYLVASFDGKAPVPDSLKGLSIGDAQAKLSAGRNTWDVVAAELTR